MGDAYRVIVPFRDRGDPLRKANLQRVLEHWAGHPVTVVDDGRTGDSPFCRSKAYNRAARQTSAQVLVFTESDMLIDHHQISEGIQRAASAPGLVVPFTTYRYLSPTDSERVRRHEVEPEECVPESTMDNGTSIGAINIVSRETLELVGGYDERFEGSWYDDRAMCKAFEVCTQPTRYVDGPAHHLYHLPGFKGDHLTVEDLGATRRNKARWKLYQQARTPQQIRRLTTERPW